MMENIVKKIWDNLKQPGKVTTIVACFGLLPTSCNEKSKDSSIKDMLYYYQNNIPIQQKDMYGYFVNVQTLDIPVYDQATLENYDNCPSYQMRWGIPKDRLGPIQTDGQTHAEYVYLDGTSDNQGWIEVFEGPHGISISKDQPCFMVDRDGYLRLIGDEEHYAQNLLRYKKETDRKLETERQRLEQRRDGYKDAHRTKPYDIKLPKNEKEKQRNISEEDTTQVFEERDTVIVPVDSSKTDNTNIKALNLKTDSVKVDSLQMER